MSRSNPSVSPSSSDANLIPRLSHALKRISKTAPRTIASPITQPRRASVAILVRVRPCPEDEAWLAEQYDEEGMPLPGSEAEVALGLGSGSGSASLTAGTGNVVTGQVPPVTRPSGEAAQMGESFASSQLPTDASTATLQSSTEGFSMLGLSGTSLQSGVNMSQSDLNSFPAASESIPLTPTASTSVGQSGAATPATLESTLDRFFALPWVQRGSAEVLYIKRASRAGDSWSAHVAFPGGRREEADENGLYTAMRETWEEVGIDLAEVKEFCCVGQLDDREITTSLGKRLLMVLSPFVFVQTSPFSPLPDLQPSEVSSAHWIPLELLFTPQPRWGVTSVDIATRLAPKSPAVRWGLRALVGKMDFRCVLLPNDPVAVAEDDESSEGGAGVPKRDVYPPGERAPSPTQLGQKPELRLWGLTLGMTLDLLSHMSTYASPASTPSASSSKAIPAAPSSQEVARLLNSSSAPGLRARSDLTFTQALSALPHAPLPAFRHIIALARDEMHLSPPPQASARAPSMTSVFPRFSYPDVNFWIWVFGWRYRAVVRGWERGVGTSMERSVNWSGMALGAFYSAVRRALIVAIALRAMGLIGVASGGSWLVARRASRRRKGLSGLGLDEMLGWDE